jgi:hypothetical protein
MYDVPGCGDAVPDPHLGQTFTIPTEVYTITTITLSGQLRVEPGEGDCCTSTTDPNDLLYLKMRDGTGADIIPGPGTQIANGGVSVGGWGPFSVDVTDVVSPVVWADQDVEVYFHGQQDANYECTFFYLDALQANVCSEWPIPPEIGGTASLGGRVQVLLHHGIPQSIPGVDVWAYSANGEVYHTQSIHNGTYHFYNIPAGTYTIYAEYWEGGVGGTIHYGIWNVTVIEDERLYTINLYLP